jgi:hypothetical protein
MAGTENKAFLIYKEQNTNGDGTTWTIVAPTEPGEVNPFELDPSPFYTISKQITPYYENEVLKHNTEYSMTLTGFIVNTGDIFVDGQNIDTTCDYITSKVIFFQLSTPMINKGLKLIFSP